MQRYVNEDGNVLLLDEELQLLLLELP